MRTLNVNEVELTGKNLIEASAGTGKTYSIAILVVRMILESENIDSIKDILVVTFTNAAVDELRDRIRLFISKTYQYLATGYIDDKSLQYIIDRQLELNSRQDVTHKIKRSLLLIDESNILTIHGFVQKVLNDFPFETRQPFKSDFSKDEEFLIEKACKSYWREVVAELPVEILSKVNIGNLSIALIDHLRKSLHEKQLWLPENLKNLSVDEFIASYLSVESFQFLNDENDRLQNLWSDERPQIIYEIAQKKIPKLPKDKWLNPEFTYKKIKEEYLKFLKNNSPLYFNHIGGYFFDDFIQLINRETELNNHLTTFYSILSKDLIDKKAAALKDYIKEHNILTFNNIILTLKRIVSQVKNDRFFESIREKYKAVFIDEFQDTDYNQFVIFNQLFIQNPSSIVFIIGDPKQSIYGFRNADIDCYLLAKRSVDNVYTMNINYRSSHDMVEAMNELYHLLNEKVMFGYDENDQEYIAYETVKSNKNIQLQVRGAHHPHALTFHPFENIDLVIDNIVKTVTQILSPEYNYTFYNVDTGTYTTAKPSDIGILVRRKNEGAKIKFKLTALGIPCIQMFDGKIFETEETIHLIQILESFLEPNLENIKKAIYFSFLKYIPAYKAQSSDEVINENIIIPYYSKYNELVSQQKTYEALYAFLEDFGVRQYFSKFKKHVHILSHIEQLLQIINTYQYTRKSSTSEVIQWMRDNYNKVIDDGDEYQMMLESDESAVKIITIHKSKGLEYPITIIVGDNNPAKLKNDVVDMKIDGQLDTMYTHKHLLDDFQEKTILNKIEQENRRLLYVALTRGVYRTFYFFSTKKPHFVKELCERIDNTPLRHVQLIGDEVVAAEINIDKEQHSLTSCEIKPHLIHQFAAHQVMLSYSGLSKHHEHYIAEDIEIEDESKSEVDQLLLRDLPRGAYVGTIVHELFQELNMSIFQHSDFDTAPKSWLYLNATKNIKYLLGDNYNEKTLYASLYNILNAHLTDHTHQKTIRLSQIAHDSTLHELEFNFSLDIEDAQVITDYLQNVDAFAAFNFEKMKGLMNGFIDLIFEYEGRYYILDWKTNHLGQFIGHYTSHRLYDVMTMNNYHLQYYIYTLALHLYLKERLENYDFNTHIGGAFYLFVRGCRAMSDHGVFYNKPDENTILQMEKLMTNKK